MGVGFFYKIFYDNYLKLNSLENYPNISTLIIPFSEIIGNKSTPDIYKGNELIPFKEKDSKFKKILINEFLI